MSHEKLIELIRQLDRSVLKARDKRDEARQQLDSFMRVFDVSSEESIETSEEYKAWEESKNDYVFALINFNREIANA